MAKPAAPTPPKGETLTLDEDSVASAEVTETVSLELTPVMVEGANETSVDSGTTPDTTADVKAEGATEGASEPAPVEAEGYKRAKHIKDFNSYEMNPSNWVITKHPAGVSAVNSNTGSTYVGVAKGLSDIFKGISPEDSE